MADRDTTEHHTTRETRVEKSSGSFMPFVLGGVVVALGIIAWVLFGGGDVSVPGTGGGGDTSVSITNESGGGESGGSSGGGEAASGGGESGSGSSGN